MTEPTLEEVAEAGYVIDEWERWQQGHCGTYALALIQQYPQLRLAAAGLTENGGGDASDGWMTLHFYAHDDTTAYDSAGRHPLPYLGIHEGAMDYAELDTPPGIWDILYEEGTDEDDLADALDHAQRHGIIPA